MGCSGQGLDKKYSLFCSKQYNILFGWIELQHRHIQLLSNGMKYIFVYMIRLRGFKLYIVLERMKF